MGHQDPGSLLPLFRSAACFSAIAVWELRVAACCHSLATLLVDDLPDHVAGLAKRGLETDSIDTIPGVVRKTAISDPDGTRITFGESHGDSEG